MTTLQTKVQPLGKRVLIKRSQAVKSKGGIILPDSAQEKPRQGEVIAVGPGALDTNGKTIPLTVQIGQTVLYSSYSGTQVDAGESDEEFLILSEDDILGIIE